MPRNSQFKALGLVLVLAVLTIYYVMNGARDTKQSPFYTRTVAAIAKKKSAEERKDMLAEEKQRHERVERIRVEHDMAVSTSSLTTSESTSKPLADDTVGPKNQKPLVDDVKDAAADSEKSVAGRKKMKDDKVVEGKPLKDNDDGVAKVGNVESKATNVVKTDEKSPETEEEHKVEVELNDILKKGPIIVFSKSYCPYSKKAKHILLDLYNINPPPYVVELDTHPLGPGLQQALGKSTGRRTVPNILVNGRSIGGGDDIAELHENNKLKETILSLGGKRITSIAATDIQSEDAGKKAVKFKA